MGIISGIISLFLFGGAIVIIALAILNREHFKVKISVAGLLIVLMVAVNSVAIIPTGYTGVRVTMGQISSSTVKNGFNWKIPFIQSIKTVNNKQQDIKYSDKIWSETSTRTAVYAEDLVVTYTIDPDRSAWVYTHVSDYTNMISLEVAKSAFKAASKTFDDTQVTNRSAIEPAVEKVLQESLDNKFDVGVIHINKVSLGNIDFDDQYNKAIADKQNSQLEYEKQQIINKNTIEKAEADAKAKVIEAEGDAKANSTMQQSLTDDILRQAWIDKWNGSLPTTVAGSDTSLIIGK